MMASISGTEFLANLSQAKPSDFGALKSDNTIDSTAPFNREFLRRITDGFFLNPQPSGPAAKQILKEKFELPNPNAQGTSTVEVGNTPNIAGSVTIDEVSIREPQGARQVARFKSEPDPVLRFAAGTVSDRSEQQEGELIADETQHAEIGQGVALHDGQGNQGKKVSNHQGAALVATGPGDTRSVSGEPVSNDVGAQRIDPHSRLRSGQIPNVVPEGAETAEKFRGVPSHPAPADGMRPSTTGPEPGQLPPRGSHPIAGAGEATHIKGAGISGSLRYPDVRAGQSGGDRNSTATNQHRADPGVDGSLRSGTVEYPPRLHNTQAGRENGLAKPQNQEAIPSSGWGASGAAVSGRADPGPRPIPEGLRPEGWTGRPQSPQPPDARASGPDHVETRNRRPDASTVDPERMDASRPRDAAKPVEFGPMEKSFAKDDATGHSVNDHRRAGNGRSQSDRLIADPSAEQATPKAVLAGTPVHNAADGIGAEPPIPEHIRLAGTSDLSVSEGRSAHPTAPAQTAGSTPAAPMRPPTLQIVEALQLAPGTVDITLSPEELGRVSLTMSFDDGNLIVTIAADRADTLDLLRRHANLLSAEARAAGFANTSFSFDTGSSDREGSDGNPAGHEEEPSSDAQPATAIARPPHSTPVTGGTSLDLRF